MTGEKAIDVGISRPTIPTTMRREMMLFMMIEFLIVIVESDSRVYIA